MSTPGPPLVLNGYLTTLKAALVDALHSCFDAEYPVEDFRSVHADIEFPVDEQSYPGIWVNYTDTSPLQAAGIDHHEFTDPDTSGQVRRYTRWKFSGTASFTVVALSSLERDRLYDELVRVIAFAREADEVPEFRQHIEDNEFIAMNGQFDTIEVSGNSAAPGTPWGTDEYIYEITLNLDVLGEFISNGESALLVPLSEILVIGRPALPDANGQITYPDETAYPLGPSDVVITANQDSAEWH